jgi:hypothetical protein
MKLVHILIFGIIGTAAVAACGPNTGAGANPGEIGDDDDDVTGDDDDDDSGSAGTAGAAGSAGSAGSAGAAGAGGTTTTKAKAFYISDVHAKLSAACGGCHVSGSGGAPKFMAADAAGSYTALDQRALIVADSLLVTKGTHASGSAPALGGEARTKVDQWLAMEAVDRKGQATPNLLQIAADCATDGTFPTQVLSTLLTVRRQNENGNTCTGCQNTQCASCHNSGEANTLITTQVEANRMVAFYRQKESISRFIGIENGKLVESKVFEVKATATQADNRPANVPKHPMYIINPIQSQAIAAYAQAIITKFNAGQCPGQTGTPGGDAGAR